MKKNYLEPQIVTRAFLQDVTITTDEDDELASMSLGDNDVSFDW